MDTETFEQIAFPSEVVGVGSGYIVSNGTAIVLSADGEVVRVEPPAHWYVEFG